MINWAEMFIHINTKINLEEIENELKDLTIEEFLRKKEGSLGKDYSDHLLLCVYLKNTEIENKNLRLGMYLRMVNKIGEELKNILNIGKINLIKVEEKVEKLLEETSNIDVLEEDFNKSEEKAKEYQRNTITL